MKIKASNANQPTWKTVSVKSTLPEALSKLDELAHNMWWAWNHSARSLFRSLDEQLFDECGGNPVLQLERLGYEKLESLATDKNVLRKMNDVYAEFRAYMDVEPDSSRASVAYFCMEYGLNQVLKIYSGGLGILAGDYLKEASDSNVDMCAVGFLYRYGYFTQSLSMAGEQIANYEAQDFHSLPVEQLFNEDGTPFVIDVPYIDYQVHAYVWQVNVGRIKLYLLDTDNELNSQYDRPITHALYGRPDAEKTRHHEGCISLQRGTRSAVQRTATGGLGTVRDGLHTGAGACARFVAIHRSYASARRPRLFRREPLLEVHERICYETWNFVRRVHRHGPHESRG